MINSRSVLIGIDDDEITLKLLDIAKRHCKLVLEHEKVNTPPIRKEAIRAEIEHLRARGLKYLNNKKINSRPYWTA